MHPNTAFKMLSWLCLDHHKNLSVIYDFFQFFMVFQDQKGLRQFVFLLDFIYFHPDGKKFLGFQCSEISICLSTVEYFWVTMKPLFILSLLSSHHLCLTGWMVQSLYEVQNVHLNSDVIRIICNWKQWHTSSL